MENTEEIYTDFARVYDELMDNTPYEMWCERLNRLIAFLENNVNEDGSVNIPVALRPYMGGKEKVLPKK